MFIRANKKMLQWAALTALFAIGPASPARAQNATEFYFKRDAGGFQGPSAGNLAVYGDTSTRTGENGLRKITKDPALRALLPLTITNALLTRWLQNGESLGGLYWKQPVDLSKGFRTKFFIYSQALDGFAFVVKHPDSTKYVGSGGILGRYGFEKTKTLAVAFSPSRRTVSLWKPFSGTTTTFNPLCLLDSRTITVGTTGNGVPRIFGTLIVQYSARSKVLDVFYWDYWTGIRERVIHRENFDLNSYGVLKNGMAHVGFTCSAQNRSGANDYSQPPSLQGWEFGNNVSLLGITSTSYSERMVFKTRSKTSVWNPMQYPNADGEFEKEYNFTAVDKKVDESAGFDIPLIGGFGAGIEGKVAAGGGVRFKGEMKEGNVELSYPLFLNLAFPPQSSLSAGQPFRVQAYFEPDAVANFKTISPEFSLQAFLKYLLEFDLSIFVDYPGGDEEWELPRIPRKSGEVTIFDSTEAFRALGNTANVSGAMQDGKYAANASGLGRTGKPGTVQGARRGQGPMNYIALRLTKPNLGTTGYVDPFEEDKPTHLTGKTASHFAGLRADFTAAMPGPIGLIGMAMNQDFHFDAGGGAEFALGWHLADFYGDVDTTVDMDHRFIPRPYLVLRIEDLSDDGRTVLATRYSKMELKENGSVAESGEILASARPMRFTPIVYLANPNHDPKVTEPDSTLTITPPNPEWPEVMKAFNTLQSTAHVNLGGSLGFNPFQIYATIPDVVDLNAQVGPYTLPLGSGAVYTRSSNPFQISNIDPVAGKAYYLYSIEASNPIIDSAIPAGVIIPANRTGYTHVQLLGNGIGPGMKLLADGQDTGLYVEKYQDQLHVAMPNAWLQNRGVYSLAVKNSANGKVSNEITFEVSAPRPAITSLPINEVTLYDSPTNELGKPVVGDGYMDLMVQGTGFADQALNPDKSVRFPSSIVEWNGQPVETTYNQGSIFTQGPFLLARIPKTFLTYGSATITVRTTGLGGGVSNAKVIAIRNPKPIPDSVNTSLLSGNDPFSLVADGSNFVPESKIVLRLQSGEVRTLETAYASSKMLSAEIGVGSIPAGRHKVMVLSPHHVNGYSKEFDLHVDYTAPTTTATWIGLNTERNTAKGSVTMRLAATELPTESGVDKICYVLDGGYTQEYAGEVTITGGGRHVVTFWSVDRAGNEEKKQTVRFSIYGNP